MVVIIKLLLLRNLQQVVHPVNDIIDRDEIKSYNLDEDSEDFGAIGRHHHTDKLKVSNNLQTADRAP